MQQLLSVCEVKIYLLTDRCNYFYTVLVLVFFSLLIGTKQHFGEPIRCLVDQQYSGEKLAIFLFKHTSEFQSFVIQMKQ